MAKVRVMHRHFTTTSTHNQTCSVIRLTPQHEEVLPSQPTDRDQPEVKTRFRTVAAAWSVDGGDGDIAHPGLQDKDFTMLTVEPQQHLSYDDGHNKGTHNISQKSTDNYYQDLQFVTSLESVSLFRDDS